MELRSKNLAFLVADFFEQLDLEVPYARLQEKGASVTIVALDHKQLHARQGLKPGSPFEADALLSEIAPDDYDGLILPGGITNIDILRTSERVKAWIRDFIEQDRLIGAIGHAAWLFVSADVLDRRRLTSYPTIQDDIENAGGEWVDQAVVIDDSLVTSRHADDLPVFLEAFLHLLTRRTPDNALAEDVEDTLLASGMRILHPISKSLLAAIRATGFSR